MPALSEVHEAVGEIRVVDDARRQAGKHFLDFPALVSNHHDDGIGPRSQRLLDCDPDQGPAADLGQELVGSAHAGRTAGGEHDRGDPAGHVGNRFLARLRPGHDLHQKAADAHPGDRLARHLEARQQSREHPIETIFLGRAGATRGAQNRPATGAADQQQIAGIDRHPKMLDAPADRLHCGRNHVAAVGDCGGAEHDHQFGPRGEHLVDGLRECALLVRDPPLGDDRSTSRRQPLLGHPQGFFDHLGGQPGEQRRDNADLAKPIGRDRHQRRSRLRNRECVVTLLGRNRERNDLHRRDHLTGAPPAYRPVASQG